MESTEVALAALPTVKLPFVFGIVQRFNSHNTANPNPSSMLFTEPVSDCLPEAVSDVSGGDNRKWGGVSIGWRSTVEAGRGRSVIRKRGCSPLLSFYNKGKVWSYNLFGDCQMHWLNE